MRIFISYPRELEKSAEEIYWGLLGWGFLDIFLDSETLHAGDRWKVVIERQISEASAFIILYDHGAAENKSRYFYAELERIKKECKNIEKFFIAVLFPPTTPENLPKNFPTYLKALQVIASTTKEIDHRSINTVIENVRRWEAERQKAEKQEAATREAKKQRDIQDKIRKYALAFSLLTAILILAGSLFFRPTVLRHISTTADDPWAVSKKTCEELLNGKRYDLWGNYTLIEKQDIKATSEKGNWTPKSCEQSSAPVGTYILNGEEKTEQKVEVKIEINGKYEHVAQAENDSRSKLTIDKEGRLVDRQIYYEREGPFNGVPKIRPVRETEQVWKKHEGHIRKKLAEYEVLLEDTHIKATKTMHCIPTRGKKEDNRDIIAFTCVIDPSSADIPKYTRVMVKQN